MFREQTWENLDEEIQRVNQGELWRTRYYCQKCKRVHIYKPDVYKIGVEHLKYRVPFGELTERCDGCGKEFKVKEGKLKPVILPYRTGKGVIYQPAFFKCIIPEQVVEKIVKEKGRLILSLCEGCFHEYFKRKVK